MASGTLHKETVVRTYTWTYHIYDLNTKKFEVTGTYYRFDKFYLGWWNYQLPAAYNIDTMLVIRNLPMTTTLLGTVYCNLTGSVGSTNQITTQAFYPRPNIIGTLGKNSWFTGCIIGI